MRNNIQPLFLKEWIIIKDTEKYDSNVISFLYYKDELSLTLQFFSVYVPKKKLDENNILII